MQAEIKNAMPEHRIFSFFCQQFFQNGGQGLRNDHVPLVGKVTAVCGVAFPELAGGPFFTVTDASGAPQTIYFNGTTFVDLAGNQISLETHAALCQTFLAAESITLTQGGLSVVFEFYH